MASCWDTPWPWPRRSDRSRPIIWLLSPPPRAGSRSPPPSACCWRGGAFYPSVRSFPVAVAPPKGWQQIAAAIGVLLAGGAYLPIDPTLPAARRHHLLARGEAPVVLVVGASVDWSADVRVIDIDRLAPAPLPAVLPARQ